MEGRGVVKGAIFAVLEGISFFFVVFSAISSVVDISKEIVLFLEKLRIESVPGWRVVCHLVVIN